MEAYLDRDGELDLKGQTEHCGLAIAEDLGLAFVTDDDLGTLGVVSQNPALRTAEDIGVGSTSTEVARAYGERATVTSTVSQTGGPIVVVGDEASSEDPDGFPRLLAFDTDTQRTVTRVRAGLAPWVRYTDYCSDDAGRSHLRTGWPLTRTSG